MQLNTSQRAAVLVACIGIFVAYLPVVGVPVILGEIAAATGASTAQLQWVTSSGLLAMAITVLSAGAFARAVSRRAVLMFGFTLIALGALISTLSWVGDGSGALPWLYVGQAAIGVGGGALLTSTLALISEVASDQHQRTVFISLWASALVIGSGIGPFIAGAVTAVTDWNGIFIPLIVIASLMVPVTATLIPRSPSKHAVSLDVRGQISAGIAVTALVFGIIEGPSVGWQSKQTVITFVISAITLLLFVIIERASDDPLVPLNLFGSFDFIVAAVGALMNLYAMVGIVFVLTLFLSGAQDASVMEIAVRIGVLFLFAAIAGPATAQLHRFFSSSVLLVSGLIVAAVGVFSTRNLDSTSSWFDVAWPLVIFGCGVGAVMATVSSVAIHAAPPHHAGMAGATNTLFRQIGAALGPSVSGTVLASRLNAGHDLIDAFHTCTTVIASALAITATLAALVLLRPRQRDRRH